MKTKNKPLTAAKYKAIRKACGTQSKVAAQLGAHRTTIARREQAGSEITVEASLALLYVASKLNNRVG